MIKQLQVLIAVFFVLLIGNASAQNERSVWTKQTANEWYKKWGWLRGCDFIPSTAINQLEMWQAETFDSATINRELGYAESIGMNVMRVYLHHVAWQADKEGFKNRMNIYLSIANKHGISTIFVFFDDCWNATYHAGTQPAPKTGIHNSGWVRDPGQLLYDSAAIISTLEAYVKDVLNTFRYDKRIFLWDLYNEPGNSDYGNKSLPLLKDVFIWARQANPDQPLSAGVWNKELPDLNAYQLANSDVITYHNYDNEKNHKYCIDTLKKNKRPLVCTEYMARTRNSKFFNIMPMLKAEHIVAINWGLVAGKTNTMYAWDTPMPNGEEPKIWFHDIFRKNGTPFDSKETVFIKSLTGKK
ncbi:MAG: 1,4-beta-xylanase [Parafilimonas sp.]